MHSHTDPVSNTLPLYLALFNVQSKIYTHKIKNRKTSLMIFKRKKQKKGCLQFLKCASAVVNTTFSFSSIFLDSHTKCVTAIEP